MRHAVGLMPIGFALLSACAAPEARPLTLSSAETIHYTVGPCMGYCPVYNVMVTPSGMVSFNGERHTATLGMRLRSIKTSEYLSVLSELAPHRPASGTHTETECKTRASDLPHHRITWTGADGRMTTLEHYQGCRSPANDALSSVLDGLPGKLGIGELARQVTRPGASRG